MPSRRKRRRPPAAVVAEWPVYCNGEEHRLQLDTHGRVRLPDHESWQAELVAHLLGGHCGCVAALLSWRNQVIRRVMPGSADAAAAATRHTARSVARQRQAFAPTLPDRALARLRGDFLSALAVVWPPGERDVEFTVVTRPDPGARASVRTLSYGERRIEFSVGVDCYILHRLGLGVLVDPVAGQDWLVTGRYADAPVSARADRMRLEVVRVTRLVMTSSTRAASEWAMAPRSAWAREMPGWSSTATLPARRTVLLTGVGEVARGRGWGPHACRSVVVTGHTPL